jgi:hypothetical protein
MNATPAQTARLVQIAASRRIGHVPTPVGMRPTKNCPATWAGHSQEDCECRDGYFTVDDDGSIGYLSCTGCTRAYIHPDGFCTVERCGKAPHPEWPEYCFVADGKLVTCDWDTTFQTPPYGADFVIY